MLRLLTTGIFWTGILCSNFCYGQSREIPLAALPMQYNSSFAGEGHHPRFSSNISFLSYRHIYSDNDYNLELSTSFDQFIPAIKSGVGVKAGYLYSSNNGQYYKAEIPSIFNVGIAIAPKISINGKVTISPSLDFNYNHHRSEKWEIKDYQSRIGLLVNTSKGYIGISADLYRASNVIKETDNRSLPYYLDYMNRGAFSLQMGYTFQRTTDAKFSFTPQLVIPLKYEENQFLDYSKLTLNFRYKKFLFGVSDVGVHAGWQTDRLQIVGSYSVERFLSTFARPNLINLSFQYTFKR